MVSDAADRQLVPPRQQSSDVSFELLEELPTGMLNKCCVCDIVCLCQVVVPQFLLLYLDNPPFCNIRPTLMPTFIAMIVVCRRAV